MFGHGLTVAGPAELPLTIEQRQIAGALGLSESALHQLVTSMEDGFFASSVRPTVDPWAVYGLGGARNGFESTVAGNLALGWNAQNVLATHAVFAGNCGYVAPSGGPPPPRPRPRTREELACCLEPHVRKHRRPCDLVDEVLDDLRALGIVRRDSQPKTALRRLKGFLSRYVYGVLVPIDALSPEVQKGLLTGGTQRVHSNGSGRALAASETARHRSDWPPAPQG